MRYCLKGLPATVFAALCLSSSFALAGQALSVENDQSQMMALPSEPGSIVVGNPSIVDVSVQGSKLFVHGRSFGTTNVIVMDLDGNQIANMDVSVTHEVDNTVALYRGPDRISYNCAPKCETELQVGDQVVHFASVMDQMKSKLELSTGQESAKSEAPPAPQ